MKITTMMRAMVTLLFLILIVSRSQQGLVLGTSTSGSSNSQLANYAYQSVNVGGKILYYTVNIGGKILYYGANSGGKILYYTMSTMQHYLGKFWDSHKDQLMALPMQILHNTFRFTVLIIPWIGKALVNIFQVSKPVVYHMGIKLYVIGRWGLYGVFISAKEFWNLVRRRKISSYIVNPVPDKPKIFSRVDINGREIIYEPSSPIKIQGADIPIHVNKEDPNDQQFIIKDEKSNQTVAIDINEFDEKVKLLTVNEGFDDGNENLQDSEQLSLIQREPVQELSLEWGDEVEVYDDNGKWNRGYLFLQAANDEEYYIHQFGNQASEIYPKINVRKVLLEYGDEIEIYYNNQWTIGFWFLNAASDGKNYIIQRFETDKALAYPKTLIRKVLLERGDKVEIYDDAKGWVRGFWFLGVSKQGEYYIQPIGTSKLVPYPKTDVRKSLD